MNLTEFHKAMCKDLAHGSGQSNAQTEARRRMD